MPKRLHILGMAMAIALAGTATAQASTVYFEFSGDSILPGFGNAIQQVPGTVTGHIDGLVNNSSASPSGLFIDSAPTALHFDYSINLADPNLFSISSPIKNSFAMNSGIVENYYFNANGGTKTGVYFLITNTSDGPFIPFAGLTVKLGNTFPGVVSNQGVSFSSTPFSVSPVPLPGGLPMFAMALLGLFGLAARRSNRLVQP